MRLTVRHRFDFGAQRELVGDDLVRPEAWDALRTCTSGPFAIASTRAELEAQLDARPDIGERARAVDAWLRDRDVRTVASYGVGTALLELGLHRLAPERRILATDYGPVTLARLRQIFPEVTAVDHDMRIDDPLDADIHFFHRVDTELSNRTWRALLRRFAHVPILVGATGVHDLRSLLGEVRKARSGATKAGWARNRDAFEALWRHTHDARALRLHDLDGWALEPRRPRADQPGVRTNRPSA